MKGLDDTIKAVKELINARKNIKACNCTNEHFIDDVYLTCKNCNGKVTLKNKP